MGQERPQIDPLAVDNGVRIDRLRAQVSELFSLLTHASRFIADQEKRIRKLEQDICDVKRGLYGAKA